MSLTVDDIKTCLEGVVPATMTTADTDGVPHVVTLSKVEYVDATHIALSRQFFRTTVANLANNPRACVFVTDPITYAMYKLHARFVRSENEGPLFERMRTRIEAIASMMGMEDVFRLQAADVFEVDRVESVAGARSGDPP